MHEGTVNLAFSPNLTNNHELHQGLAPPGLTYLTYRWRVKQGEEDNEAQAKNVAMHLCVCLITLILPLIIRNLSDLSLYRVLSCYQAWKRRHMASTVRRANRTSTPAVYT